MVDFNAFLERKYQVLEQNAQSEATRARSAAELTGAQAKAIPGTTAAEIALRNAQARGVNVTSDLAPGIAQSEATLRGTQGVENQARAGLYGAQTIGEGIANDALGMSAPNALIDQLMARAGIARAGGAAGSAGTPVSGYGAVPPANTVATRSRVGGSAVYNITGNDSPAPASSVGVSSSAPLGIGSGGSPSLGLPTVGSVGKLGAQASADANDPTRLGAFRYGMGGY